MNVFLKQAEQQGEYLADISQTIVNLLKGNELFGDLKRLEDISMVSIYQEPGGRTYYTFTLLDTKSDSKFIHKLAQAFGVKFVKMKNQYGTQASLEAVGASQDGKMHFTVRGYVPSSCRVETTIVDLPESEWVVTKTKTVTKVVCPEEHPEVVSAVVAEPELAEFRGTQKDAMSGEEVPF